MPSRLDHHLHALREPTEAQKEAGNYPKRRVRFAGLPISIENPRGSIRRGGPPGREWAVGMAHDYGYIRGTLGVDGDHFDVLLGTNQAAPTVYLVTTRCPPDFTRDDEQKALLGFSSEAEARAAFLGMYDDPRFLGELRAMPVEEFRAKVMTTRAEPRLLKARVLFLKAAIPGGAHGDLFATPVMVQGHTRGASYVAPYLATRQKQADAGDKLARLQARRDPDGIEPETRREALLAADRATYERAIYDAAMARLDSGQDVRVSTSLRTTVIGPKHRDALRFADGQVQMRQGSGWVSLGPVGQSIDSLATHLGLPTSYQRIAAKAERDAADPAARDARIAAAAAEMEPLFAERDRARAMDDSHEKDALQKDVARRIQAKARSLDVFAQDVEEWRDEHPPAARKAPVIVLAKPPALPAREQLGRLRQRIDQTAREIAARLKEMTHKAERVAMAKEPGRGQFFGRGTTAWTKRQEKWFQDALGQLLDAEGGSLRAAISRYDRLAAQQEADAKRLGVNEPWRPASPPAAELRSRLGAAKTKREAPHTNDSFTP